MVVMAIVTVIVIMVVITIMIVMGRLWAERRVALDDASTG